MLDDPTKSRSSDPTDPTENSDEMDLNENPSLDGGNVDFDPTESGEKIVHEDLHHLDPTETEKKDDYLKDRAELGDNDDPVDSERNRLEEFQPTQDGFKDLPDVDSETNFARESAYSEQLPEVDAGIDGGHVSDDPPQEKSKSPSSFPDDHDVIPDAKPPLLDDFDQLLGSQREPVDQPEAQVADHESDFLKNVDSVPSPNLENQDEIQNEHSNKDNLGSAVDEDLHVQEFDKDPKIFSNEGVVRYDPPEATGDDGSTHESDRTASTDVPVSGVETSDGSQEGRLSGNEQAEKPQPTKASKDASFSSMFG